jgi:hypothetical protein
MGKSIIEKMDEFIQDATPESFIEDCKRFGIKLEEVEFSDQEIGNYIQESTSTFSCNQNKYCIAA